MKILYMATAEIAGPVLRALHASEHELVGVLSQPDRPQGRKRRLGPSPVKALALELGLPVFTPEKVGSDETRALLAELQPDINIVFAYGQYIPASVTDAPPYHSINLHPSLLPRYRGAAPIQWAIADGLEASGISVISVSPQMDAGDIWCQQPVPIDPDETSASLSDKMAAVGSDLILEALDLVLQPDFAPRVQDEAEATETRKLGPDDRVLDWTRPAVELRNWIRACQPWPGTTFEVDGEAIKLLAAEVVDTNGEPGTRQDDEWPVFACGDGGLRLVTVQPPGKKPMAGDAWLRGLRG